MSRKISAHYVFPVTEAPIKNGIIEIDDDGVILSVINPGKEIKERAGVEFYSGILVPGFVNTHCHIELSHLKGKIPEHTGLHHFISQISKVRISDEELILNAIVKADREMKKNGIVAVGDISNTNHSFDRKRNSDIYYHTFIELFSLNPHKATELFDSGIKLEEELKNVGLEASIVPHTPYSVSKKLFQLIMENAKKSKKTISLHNQECASENELFISKTGKIFDSLSGLGVDFSDFNPSGKNSLKSIIQYLPKKNNCLLVHNTFSTEHDINVAETHFENVYWTFCPNANIYIENRLPDIQLFFDMKQKCTIGTDSLCSNHQLSVLEELKTINSNFPQIPLSTLINWATINGAEALNIADRIGSFEIGKKPGVNLINYINYEKMQLKVESKVKKLI